MVKEIVRDAIVIKLKIRQESPIISVAEFYFASGLAAQKMQLSQEQTDALMQISDFGELKAAVGRLVKESDVWESFPEGARLQRLLAGCRLRAEINDEAKELFKMGLDFQL